MRGGRSCSCSLGGSGGSQAGTAQGVPAICGLTPTEGRAEPAAAWDLVTCMCTHPISALTGAWSRVCAYTPHHGTYWGPVTCVCLHTPSWHLLGPGWSCVCLHTPSWHLLGPGTQHHLKTPSISAHSRLSGCSYCQHLHRRGGRRAAGQAPPLGLQLVQNMHWAARLGGGHLNVPPGHPASQRGGTDAVKGPLSWGGRVASCGHAASGAAIPAPVCLNPRLDQLDQHLHTGLVLVYTRVAGSICSL